MLRETRVLRVVVASPSDVQKERDTLPRVVEELNRGIAVDRNVRLELVRWETDAYPGFHPEHAQGLIDTVLQVQDCDLLIGVFWKRFGTPTKHGESGTQHEIRLAYEAWKTTGRPQIMIYFNQSPYSPQTGDEIDQWAKVVEFRRMFPDEGLWWPYLGAADFERLVRNHLTAFIRAMPGRYVRAQSPLPPTPELFIGRSAAMRDLLGRVLPGHSGESEPVTIVQGWPGVGKSSLLAVIAREPGIRNGFPDGVLWATLGERPALISALDRWARTLGCDEALKLTTLSEAADRLAGLLNDRRALLILDDVWEPEHVRPFHQARGKDCVLVVSTREIGLADALNLQGRAVYNLDVLDEESAVELLSLVAPPVVERFKDDCRLLVRDLEYLPLALHVAGRLLNSELHLGWGVADMLHDLRTGAALLAAKAPADRTDLERQTIPTVAALLRQSTDRLSGTTRECFAYLGPFAPKPAMFDLDSLRSVWRTEDPRPIVRELVSRGLLEPVGGRFRMHALLILHARGLLKEM